jgi:ATP-binding cassette subfamily B protein
MWPDLRANWVLVLSVTALVISLAITGRLAIQLFGWAIDRGILANDRNWLLWAVLGYLALEVVSALLSYANRTLFALLGQRVLFDLRSRLIRHVQRLPTSFFDANPSGRLVTRVTTDVVALGSLFTQGLVSLLTSSVSLVAILVAMASVSVPVALAVSVLIPVVGSLGWALARRILKVLRETRKKQASVNSHLSEVLGGIRWIQSQGLTSRAQGEFDEKTNDLNREQIRSDDMYAMLWPILGFFQAAAVGLALYFGGMQVLSGALSTGSMVALVLHVRDFMTPLRVIIERYQQFQLSISSAERVFGLFDEAEEAGLVETVSGDARQGHIVASGRRIRGELRFEGVAFRYREDLPWALKDINLTVSPGQSVALIGRTGSGKSTLTSLLMRFHEPTEGSILIDGELLASWPARQLRRRIGYVPQDAFLYRASLRENLTLGRRDLTDECLWRALEATGFAARLDRLEGLDLQIAERGANLSAGERQLVSLSRVLARDPEILILDEATSQIDRETERLVEIATAKLREGRTTLIIAHRLSTVKGCDQVVSLAKGRLTLDI